MKKFADKILVVILTIILICVIVESPILIEAERAKRVDFEKVKKEIEQKSGESEISK